MYCGDETGAFIGDVGSSTSRFGYGGEDNPKYVVPSYVGYNNNDGDIEKKKYIPTSSYHERTSNLKSIYRLAKYDDNSEKPQVDPTAFLQQGDVVQDWDAYEYVWQTSFDVMRVRDALKHTKGSGGGAATPSSTTPKSDSSTGVTSSTVRAAPRSSDSKCVHPLLAVSSGCTHVMAGGGGDGDVAGAQYDAAVHRKQQTILTELFMEKMDASAMFIAPTPMLAAFSHGRQTGMVVDVGAGGCRVTPVVDGLVLKHAQRRTGRGGDWLGNVQLEALNTEKITVKPRYLVGKSQQQQQQSKPSSPVFHRWALQDVMYEFRTSHHVTLAPWRMDDTTPFVYPDQQDGEGGDEMEVDPNSESTYELPDGTTIDLSTRVGKDLCRLPELLFTDDVPFVPEEQTTNSSLLLAEDHNNNTLSNLPLHKLIHASLTAVGDADARKELCGNIILTGGSSLFPNMDQRLSLELTTVVPSTYKCRVIASRHSTERKFAAWIGASILTSLGSFQQLWLSRTEYEEYGATLAIQRFP